MTGNYKLKIADYMPKKMNLAFKKGKGIQVHLFKNSPGGTEYDCNLSHAQIRRFNKLQDGKQKPERTNGCICEEDCYRNR